MSKKRNASPFQAYLISYLVLVLLFLGIMIPFAANLLHKTNESARVGLYNTVERTVDSLDRTLSDLGSMLTYNHEKVIALSRSAIPVQGKAYYTMRQITQFLNPIVQANPALDEILIAYNGSDAILTSFGGFDSRRSFERYYEPGLYDALFSSGNGVWFVPSRTIRYHIEKKTVEDIGYCFALEGYGRVKICLLMNSESYFGLDYRQLADDGGCAVLMDANGNVIKSVGTLPETGAELSAARDASRFVTVQYSSADNLLTMQARAPRMLPTSDLVRVVTLILGSFLTAVVAGTAYSVLMARRHSLSVKRLAAQMTTLNSRVQSDQKLLDAMQDGMNRLQHENRDFQEKVEDFRRARLSNAVTRLFTSGNLSDEDLRCIREDWGELPERYCVAYGRLRSLPFGEDYQNETGALFLEQLLSNLPTRCMMYVAHFDSIAVLLPENLMEEKVWSVIRAENVDWTFSRVYSGAKSVCAALEEARLLSHSANHAQGVSMQSFQRLYQCLMAGDEEGTREQVETIAADMDEGNCRYMYEGFRSTLYFAGREYGDIPVLVPMFDDSRPLAEHKEQLKTAAAAFCAGVNAQKKSRNEDRKQRILDYIQDHYTDSELYAASIAEYAGISEKYLYNFVKEQTGMSVGNYLMDLRMKRAAELLSANNIPVKDVCRMVGFNSENSFYKAFKRMYGVTPSQYRESLGH